MTSLFNWRRVVRRHSTDRVFECRDCGTTVERDTDTCPTCGSAEIACYEF